MALQSSITRVSNRSALLARSSLAALCFSALIAATPAFAQTTTGANADTAATGGPNVPADTSGAQAVTAPAAAAEPGDEVVVTGIRAGLASSARTKREAAAILESVTAEDIGKLPDVSIADSLARLPGVTAQRLEGRDQRLSIRGLGPDFGTTLLNGREQVTVGDNRGVEYDQYPSEFFKSVNVYKSADASLIAAGVSGTVDLRMLRPLAQSKRVISVQARGEMNGQKSLNPDVSRYGYRASATYVDQFADDTFGIALGISATSAPSQDERYNAWGYPTDSAGNLILGGAKPYVQSNVLDRYGAVATLEWAPTDNFHSTFDALYSHFRETQHLRGIEFPLFWGGGVVATPTANSGGFDTAATFSNVHGVQRNDYNRRRADNYSLGWNNVLSLNDKMHLTVDASWSHAKRTDFLLETYTGTGYGATGPADTVKVTQNKNGTFNIVPTLNYADSTLFKITDPQGWGYNGTTPVVQAGFLNKPDFKDDLKSLRASLDGEFGDGLIHGWEVGANYSRRKKTSNFLSYFLCPKGGGTNCTVSSGTPTSAPVPSEALLKHNVALDYLGVPQMLTLNPLYIYKNSLQAVYDNRPVSLVRDNTVTENVLTGYAKLNIDGTVGGKHLHGAIGAQVVHTKQSSNGSISNFSNGTVTVLPASGHDSYTDVLPSATMSVELIDQGFVKLGASQTMVRPRLDQERVNQELSVDFAKVGSGSDPQYSPFSSKGGNVALRPYKSTNFDVSLEKYFGSAGYVSLAGYYKKLTDFVDPNNSFAYDFSSALSLLPPAAQAIVTTQHATTGLVSAPDNTGKGDIMGFEATLSLPFNNLHHALEGFGFYGNVSYNKSAVIYGSDPGNEITIPGLSKWVGSGELYYDRKGIQARVSYRFRSKFLGEVAGLSAAPTFRQVKAEGILDAQIGYEFQSGPLKGLSILAQAKNLTDRPFVTYQNNDRRQVIDYQRYGRDYYLGIAYKL
jgi:iron complex outermembrane recepter protein